MKMESLWIVDVEKFGRIFDIDDPYVGYTDLSELAETFEMSDEDLNECIANGVIFKAERVRSTRPVIGRASNSLVDVITCVRKNLRIR
jgi:hypothetical protein